MTNSICIALETKSRNQSSCSLWRHAKYARVTASKLHEAANCRTPNGLFVEGLLGAKLKQTQAMKRGIKLERHVANKVEERLKLAKLEKAGLFLSPDFPVFGASPDGVIGCDAVVEIKCPSSEKARKAYISDSGEITSKYNTQVQLQMLLTSRTKGFFCVASPDVEETGCVDIIEVLFDRDFVLDLTSRALHFWKLNVFPKMVEFYS
jgi:hypothetical protein